MQTLNQALARLVGQGLVSESEAMAKSSDTEHLESLLKTTGQMAYQRD